MREVQVQVPIQTLALIVPQVPSSRRCPPGCSYFSSPFLLMTVLGVLDVRHGVAAGTQRLSVSATRNFYSAFSTLFLMYFPCCLLLVMGSCCMILILKCFGDIKPIKCNPNQSSMPVEDKQDQSMKGCSHKRVKIIRISTMDCTIRQTVQLRLKYFTCL